MKWAYSMSAEGEPIIKDMQVYDATAVTNGEYLQLGTSAFTAGADAGYALVSCTPTTVAATQGVNGVGCCLQTITTAGNLMPYSLAAPASVALAGNSTAGSQVGLRATSSFPFAKVIINPLAVYRTLVGPLSSGALSVSSATGAQDFCVTGLPVSSFNGAWVYFCGSAGPNYGTIRTVVSSATAGTMHLDAACTNTITTADKVAFISQVNNYPYIMSNAGAVTSNQNVGTTVGQTTVASTGVANFRVVENYIEGGTYTGGITELRYNVQGQYAPAYNGTTPLVNKLSTVNFYQDLISLNNAFNASSTAY